jgi:hypothetical protein
MTRRDHIMQQALRAAAAATGRATRTLQVATTVCAALLGAGCGDQHAALAEETLDSSGATQQAAEDATSTPTSADAVTPATSGDAAAPSARDLTSASEVEAPHTACGLTAAGLLDWRCCTDAPTADAEVPTWNFEREGCGLCFSALTDDSDWDTVWDCCTQFSTLIHAACAAEPDEDTQGDCYMAQSAVQQAQPRCTPWGPPAPPRWTGARSLSLPDEVTPCLA